MDKIDSKPVIIFLIITGTLVVGMLYYFHEKSVYTLNFEDAPTEYLSSTIDISNWKSYTNSEYGFEVKYPKD